MPPADLPSYVGWVIDQKPELRDTPDDVKRELQQQLEERLEDLINAALLAAMPPNELEFFEKLLTHGTKKQIQDFCESTIPNMEEIVADVLLRFRNDYVGT